jgi:hypothetical protein
MVLTRAQRAQTKATPPESPLKSGVQKAPVRRGRGKKETEDEKEMKTTKTTKATKAPTAAKIVTGKNNVELKSSVSRTASARTATTKASTARAAAGPTKSTNARVAATKTAVEKTIANKASTGRKTMTAVKTGRAVRTAKKYEPIVEDKDYASGALEIATKEAVRDLGYQQNEAGGQTSGNAEDSTAEGVQKEETEAPTPSSPTKLPRPVTSPTKPVSPIKSSLLSSVQGLGSIRKPAMSGALLASPTKPGLMAPPPANPAMIMASPVCFNTSIHDFATIPGSPRRPGSSGSDNCSAGSAASTPKRPRTDESTHIISPKRLRTSISMPALGSPQRSQSSTSDSPPSPAKSSMRSPEKRPNISPKKVSWHQTPPHPATLQEKTPPPKQPGILEDCVFFLDINSLTGANQNSLFVGLIKELGGVSVQEWTHNNMGITHVLFMNGEMRTLEKVLASNGEVFCVSLGWLLE